MGKVRYIKKEMKRSFTGKAINLCKWKVWEKLDICRKKKKEKCCFEVVINSYQLINSNQFLFMFSLKMRY